jgi:6-phosphogluconolactonase
MGGKYQMMMNTYNNMEENIQHLLPNVIASIQSNLDRFNACTLALAGGNTPKLFYQTLGSVDLPWEKVSVTLTDERWVPVDHIDSNEAMVKQYFAKSLNKINFVGLKNTELEIKTGCEISKAELKSRVGHIDVVVLGMGEDGHFASIFPDAENLMELLDENNTDLCLPVTPKGKQARVSLTYAYILSAKVIYLLITGECKRKVIENIANKVDGYQRYPVAKLLNQTVCPVHIYWNP